MTSKSYFMMENNYLFNNLQSNVPVTFGDRIYINFNENCAYILPLIVKVF